MEAQEPNEEDDEEDDEDEDEEEEECREFNSMLILLFIFTKNQEV